MTIASERLARLADVLLLGGATGLVLTFLIARLIGEVAARALFDSLVAGLLAGIWLRLRIWERDEHASRRGSGPQPQ